MQKLLKTNRVKRANATNAKSPSLLTGMLDDPHGLRFKPSHCKKGNKHYRYYTGAGMSLPAHGIEILVIRELAAFLNNHSTIAGWFQNDNASDLEAMLAVAHTAAEQLKSNPRRSVLKSLLTKIVVSPDQLDIHVNLHGLREMVCDDGSDANIQADEVHHIIALRIHLKRSRDARRKTRQLITSCSVLTFPSSSRTSTF